MRGYSNKYTEADCPYSVKIRFLTLKFNLAINNEELEKGGELFDEISIVKKQLAEALDAFDGDWADWLIHQRELTEKAHEAWLEEEHQANLELTNDKPWAYYNKYVTIKDPTTGIMTSKAVRREEHEVKQAEELNL